ncbi:MAG: hypothetical protein AVDCRST_MAG69-2304, partial [uncultured Solirubrobacteraceae bacterium]
AGRARDSRPLAAGGGVMGALRHRQHPLLVRGGDALLQRVGARPARRAGLDGRVDEPGRLVGPRGLAPLLRRRRRRDRLAQGPPGRLHGDLRDDDGTARTRRGDALAARRRRDRRLRLQLGARPLRPAAGGGRGSRASGTRVGHRGRGGLRRRHGRDLRARRGGRRRPPGGVRADRAGLRRARPPLPAVRARGHAPLPRRARRAVARGPRGVPSHPRRRPRRSPLVLRALPGRALPLRRCRGDGHRLHHRVRAADRRFRRRGSRPAADLVDRLRHRRRPAGRAGGGADRSAGGAAGHRDRSRPHAGGHRARRHGHAAVGGGAGGRRLPRRPDHRRSRPAHALDRRGSARRGLRPLRAGRPAVVRRGSLPAVGRDDLADLRSARAALGGRREPCRAAGARARRTGRRARAARSARRPL